jgi:hypothetical protein
MYSSNSYAEGNDSVSEQRNNKGGGYQFLGSVTDYNSSVHYPNS